MKQSITKSGRYKKAGIMIATVLMAGGAAFAIMQSQAKLTGNSIQTGSTGLLISPNDTNYAQAASGFNFTGLIPGAQASQTEHFLLKNTGNTALALKVAAANMPTNPANVDLSKVKVILTPYSLVTFMPSTPQSFPLQSLIDANATGGAPITYPEKLAIGTKEEFNIQIAMDADAVNGSSATLANLDFIFTGAATSN
jgi:hypothetical protein